MSRPEAYACNFLNIFESSCFDAVLFTSSNLLPAVLKRSEFLFKL